MCAIRSVGGDPAIELYYNFKFFHFICGIYLCWVEGGIQLEPKMVVIWMQRNNVSIKASKVFA